MSIDIAVFSPSGNAVTVSLSAGISTSAIQFKAPGTSIATLRRVRVFNGGTVPAFVEFGGSAVTASVPSGSTGGGVPVAPGSIEMFTAAGADYVAAITSSGSATLYLTPGEGA